MNKSRVVSILFVILGALAIVGVVYAVLSYAGDMLQAIVEFITTNDFAKLQKCGIEPPTQFSKIKADLATLILPGMYIGLPLAMILISVIMFLSGFYYHKAKIEDESSKSERIEREMVHKIVKKMETEKAPSKPAEAEDVPAPSEEAEPFPKFKRQK